MKIKPRIEIIAIEYTTVEQKAVHGVLIDNKQSVVRTEARIKSKHFSGVCPMTSYKAWGKMQDMTGLITKTLIHVYQEVPYFKLMDFQEIIEEKTELVVFGHMIPSVNVRHVICDVLDALLKLDEDFGERGKMHEMLTRYGEENYATALYIPYSYIKAACRALKNNAWKLGADAGTRIHKHKSDRDLQHFLHILGWQDAVLHDYGSTNPKVLFGKYCEECEYEDLIPTVISILWPYILPEKFRIETKWWKHSVETSNKGFVYTVWELDSENQTARYSVNVDKKGDRTDVIC